MGLEDRLMQDLKIAMKNKNTIDKNTIHQIRANVLLAKKNKGNLTDRDIEDIILKEKSKRADALVQFNKAGRTDLVEQTNKEMLCLSRYLPQPMSEYEVEEAVKAVIEREAVTDKKFLGYVIKKSKEQFGNRTTGQVISSIAKKLLEGN